MTQSDEQRSDSAPLGDPHPAEPELMSAFGVVMSVADRFLGGNV